MRRPRLRASRFATHEETARCHPGLAGDELGAEQITAMLRERFPDRPQMHVCQEAIYQALYVQGHADEGTGR